MNFRNTALLFGLCLGLFWLFGLMLAYKKVTVDDSYVAPHFQKADDFDFDTVLVQRKLKVKGPDGQLKAQDPEDYTFYKVNDYWYLKDKGQSIRIEGFRIKDLVRDLKNLKKNDNAAVNARDLALYELNSPHPQVTVTIRGKMKKNNQDKEWTFKVGKDSVDNLIAYVTSSDRPDRVRPVDRTKIDSLFFKDANHLRSKRLFEAADISATGVTLKQGATDIELTRGEDGFWRFVKPALGFADYDGADSKGPPLLGAKSESGVKGLIYAIAHIQVDKEEDFMPSSDPALFGLEDGKESLRITITSPAEKKGPKDLTHETLLIGKRIDKTDQYYARLVSDQGAFKVNAKWLETVFKILKNPGELRSLDLLHLDTKTIDYVTLSPGGPEIKLFHPEGKDWLMQQGLSKIDKGNDKAVQNFLDALNGKRQIKKFIDVVDSEAKKTDELYGLSTPAAEVGIYVNALKKPKKDDKDDKKEVKKADPKDKDELPTLIEDAKPAAKLTFGKVEGDQVYVKRTLADGAVSRFTVPKTMLDLARPPDAKFDAQARSDAARLMFLKTALPEFDPLSRVRRFDIQRGSEKVEFELLLGQEFFTLKGADPKGPNALQIFSVENQIRELLKLNPKKWIKKLDPKEDLEQWGLKNPAMTVTLLTKKVQPLWETKMTKLLADAKIPSEPATTFAFNIAPLFLTNVGLPWGALANSLANEALDPGEIITFKFGKETDQDKDKPGVFAQFSGSDLLFLVPPEIVKNLREFDPRDKQIVMNFQPTFDAGLLAPAGLQSFGAMTLLSPLGTNLVMSFDPDKVKALAVTIRTPQELRNFTFRKNPKDNKVWMDESGLKEFTFDPDKVNQLVKELAKFEADRLISFGGPKVDHKLATREATLRIEIDLEGGKTIVYSVGNLFEGRHYFAHSTAWPDMVFLVNAVRVDPLLRGAGYFGKERVAGQ